MRIVIYFSGIAGILLLVIRTIGTMLEFPLNRLFLILGLVLLVTIFIPLMIINKYRQNKKIDAIINSYKGTDKKSVPLKKGDAKTQGWGMNNSPFRERRSCASWGGGNIKGASVSRGTRKPFLK